MNEEEKIDPFTVRDALIMHDKRINTLTDLSHETQQVVKQFEEKFEVLMERINKGVSPTQQEILKKQNEIEKQIIQFTGDMNLKFAHIDGRMNTADEHMDGKFTVIDDWMTRMRDLMWKLAAVGISAFLAAFFSMWVYFQKAIPKTGQPFIVEKLKR